MEPVQRARSPRTKKQTLLLTGADRPLGRLVLKRLIEDPSVGAILTIGEKAVRGRKVRTIPHTPLHLDLLDALEGESIDGVLHLDFLPNERQHDGVFEHNVLGALHLVGAACELGAKRVVVRSSTTVYGVRPTNPYYLPESRRVRTSGKRMPLLRDVTEMERHLPEIYDAYPETAITVLRFAPMVGPTSDDPWMRYLRQEPCPYVSGFDPLVQLLHEEDAAEGVLRAWRSGTRGPVNLCPDGAVPLLKMMRFLGRKHRSMPQPLLGVGEKLVEGWKGLPLEAAQLMFSVTGDNDRMKRELGFRPRTNEETLHALRDLF